MTFQGFPSPAGPLRKSTRSRYRRSARRGKNSSQPSGVSIGTGPAPTWWLAIPLVPLRSDAHPNAPYQGSCSNKYPEWRMPIIARATDMTNLPLILRENGTPLRLYGSSAFSKKWNSQNRTCSRSQWLDHGIRAPHDVITILDPADTRVILILAEVIIGLS